MRLVRRPGTLFRQAVGCVCAPSCAQLGRRQTMRHTRRTTSWDAARDRRGSATARLRGAWQRSSWRASTTCSTTRATTSTPSPAWCAGRACCARRHACCGAGEPACATDRHVHDLSRTRFRLSNGGEWCSARWSPELCSQFWKAVTCGRTLPCASAFVWRPVRAPPVVTAGRARCRFLCCRPSTVACSGSRTATRSYRARCSLAAAPTRRARAWPRSRGSATAAIP